MRNFMRKKLSLRKTYIRVFATFAILFTIIVALFTLYLVQVFSGSARDEIDQSAGSQLRQVMENTKFNLYKLRLYGMRMYSDESVKDWFADYRDPQGLVGLTNSIKEYMSSEPFIYNIDLISSVGRHVWTAREAMYSFEEFYDRELLEETVESSNPYLRFSRHDYQDQSFVKLVVREMGQAKPDGYLVMLIDAGMLEKYVLLSNEQSLVKFMITDASGKRIIGNETPENAGVLATIHNKGESLAGSFEWTGSGEKYTVRYDTVDPEGWTVYQFTPWDMWQSKISYLRNVIMLSAGGLLLLTLFFVFWISRRNYLPFSELAGLLNRNSDETDDSIRNKADYELIRNGIGKLVSQVEQMNHSINSNQHIIREDLLRQWIRNGKQSESARSMLGQVTPIVVANRLGLAILRIESYPSFEEKYSFFSRKLMKYAMGNIAEETIRGYGLDSVTIDFEEDHLVILWKDPKGNEETKGMLEETNRNIAQYLTIKCVGAFGVTSAASDLHALYRNVLELSFVKFLNGEEKIYDDSDQPSLPQS